MSWLKIAAWFLPAVITLGAWSFGGNVPLANAAPSLPAFTVEVNGVQVHRFLDTSGEFAAVCYVARNAGAQSAAISCVRAKP